jgi:hypothetical protein
MADSLLPIAIAMRHLPSAIGYAPFAIRYFSIAVSGNLPHSFHDAS